MAARPNTWVTLTLLAFFLVGVVVGYIPTHEVGKDAFERAVRNVGKRMELSSAVAKLPLIPSSIKRLIAPPQTETLDAAIEVFERLLVDRSNEVDGSKWDAYIYALRAEARVRHRKPRPEAYLPHPSDSPYWIAVRAAYDDQFGSGVEIGEVFGERWIDATLRRRASSGVARQPETEPRKWLSILLVLRPLSAAGVVMFALGQMVRKRSLLRLPAGAASSRCRTWSPTVGWGIFGRAWIVYSLIPLVVYGLIGLLGEHVSILKGQGGLLTLCNRLVSIVVLITLSCRYLPTELAMSWGKRLGWRNEIGWAVLIVAGVVVLRVVLSLGGIRPAVSEADLVLGPAHLDLQLATRTISGVLVAPMFEEIMFRWLVFNSLRAWMPGLGAAVCSGALFSLAHTPTDLGAALGTFGLGTLLALGYHWTGSLVPCVLAHAANNASSYLTAIIMAAD